MKKILKRLSSIVLISMTLMIGCIYTGATAYEYVVDYDVNMDY